MAQLRKSDLSFNPPAALAVVPSPAEPPSLTSVPTAAVLEIAEGSRSPYDVLFSHGYDESQIEWLCQHPPFTMQVDRLRAELQRNGYTFRAKAAILAEEHLATTHRIINDVNVPANVRLDGVKFLAKMGNLEPKEAAGASGGAVTVTINLGGDQRPFVLDSAVLAT